MTINTVRIGLYALFGLWAGFWLWFSGAAIIGGETGAIGHLAIPVVPILVSAVLLVKRPRLGGLFLVASAVAGAWFFQGAQAWAFLCAPALIIGLGFATLPGPKRSEPA